MTDFDRRTGEIITGFEDVQQSLETIFFTRQGERVGSEWFGNPGLDLLGENQTEATILTWFNILWMLTELFEPRYKIRSFAVNDLSQLGFAEFSMAGVHRPYAHLDWQLAPAYVSVRDGVVKIESAS